MRAPADEKDVDWIVDEELRLRDSPLRKPVKARVEVLLERFNKAHCPTFVLPPGILPEAPTEQQQQAIQAAIDSYHEAERQRAKEIFGELLLAQVEICHGQLSLRAHQGALH